MIIKRPSKTKQRDGSLVVLAKVLGTRLAMLVVMVEEQNGWGFLCAYMLTHVAVGSPMRLSTPMSQKKAA